MRAIAVVLVGLFAFAPGALADAKKDWDDCASNDPELSLAGCTSIINRGKEAKPNLAIAYANRGNAYLNSGDNDRAIADYDQAIRLNPKFADALNGRGAAHDNKGEYDLAIADYDQAIKLKPNLPEAYNNRGNAYADKGEYDLAIADYDRAISLKADYPDAYNGRGNAHASQGDDDRAIADFDQAIRLNPALAKAYRNRGASYLTKKEYERALTDCEHAIALMPGYAEAYGCRAGAYSGRNDYDRAIADYDKAIQLAGRNVSAALTDARANALANQERQAQATALAGAQAAPAAATAGPSLAASAQTRPDKRIALVIGNSAYRTVNPLKNPEADAHAIAEEFRKLGFAEVIEKQNLALNDLSAALKDFGDKAVDADWAVVYYAGHGIEVGGVNYVIPVDAELKTSAHVEEEAIPLDRVLSKVEGAHKLRLVILDACRDNPFAQRLASAGGGARSVGRGLARIEPVGGVLVAYSAQDKHVALDGDEANSPFAQALVQSLEVPGVEISLLFRKVRDQVMNKTNGEQEPFTYGSLPAEALYFKAAAQ
jgi:tetratricopeptide (TPR) repeat protein